MDLLLVIDDESGICATLQSILQTTSLRVLTSTNAVDGLQIVHDHAPQVILLDLRLGNESGLDLFHQIQRIDPRSLVIFITGHGTQETEVEARKAGAFGFLYKPLDIDQLQLIVSEALDTSRLARSASGIDTSGKSEDSSNNTSDTSFATDQSYHFSAGRSAEPHIKVSMS